MDIPQERRLRGTTVGRIECECSICGGPFFVATPSAKERYSTCSPECKSKRASRQVTARTTALRAALESETERRCRECRKVQQIEAYKRPAPGKARSHQCWDCEKRALRIRRASLRPPKQAAVTSKKCSSCCRKLPPAMYEWDALGRRRSTVCGACRNSARSEGTERCSKCKETKAATEFFWSRANGEKHSWCKLCLQSKRTEWNERNPDRMRDYQRARRMGMTVPEFRAFLSTLSPVCEICGRASERALHLDHDHTTHLFRGVLCSRCNTGIGGFGDSADLLRKCVEYLEQPPRWQITLKTEAHRPR